VSHRLRVWLLIVLIVVVCAGAVGGFAWYRSRALTPEALLRRLPVSGALVVCLDFDALRRAGILGRIENSKISEDAEYLEFVHQTGFDYKRDLDLAMLAFTPAGKFLLLRGRFDWKNLRAYVRSENGHCYNALCRLDGSTPERRISFFPIQANLMALAVSADESAAVRLEEKAPGPAPGMPPDLPAAPVWMSIPSALLQSGDLPEGARPFARHMERAESVLVSFGSEGKRLAAELNVRCRTSQDAADLASQLSRTTALLRQMMERDHQKPDPAALSGILTAGTFRSDGVHVFGHWPIDTAFLDNILAGS
jgi:hypothetical protein